MRAALRAFALIAVISTGILVATAGTASAQHYGHHYYGHGYGYYRPYGYGGYGPYGYGPYGYGGYESSPSGAVRIEVSPKAVRGEIEVYVDAARAGVVDDFDGIFQRLYLAEGEYEIELRLAGYKPFRASIFVARGSTYKLRGQMELLADDQAADGGDEQPNQPAPR